jgi:hypothetical protein
MSIKIWRKDKHNNYIIYKVSPFSRGGLNIIITEAAVGGFPSKAGQAHIRNPSLRILTTWIRTRIEHLN